MDLSERIHLIKKEKKIKSADIAKFLNMEHSNYTRLEKRGSKLTYEQIEKIAEALGVTVKYLLFGEDESIDTHKIELLEKEIEVLKGKNKYLELESSKFKENEVFARRILKLLEVEIGEGDEFIPEVLKKVNDELIDKALSFGLMYISIEEWFKENKNKKKKKSEGKNEIQIPEFKIEELDFTPSKKKTKK